MLRWHVLFRTDRTPTGACRGRVLAFLERNELLGFPAFHSQCSRATERLARRLCGSLGSAALVNTDVVASATQPADAGPVPLVPRKGQWPLLVLPSHPKKEYALLKNNVLKLMACEISEHAIVRFVSLPGTGVTADCKVEKSRSRYLGGKIP